MKSHICQFSYSNYGSTHPSGRPLAGTVGSNPTGGMHVVLLCIVRKKFLLWADPSSRGVLRCVCVCVCVCLIECWHSYVLTPRHYNPCRVLADSRKRLYPSLSLALVIQFLTRSLSASFVAPSIHLKLGVLLVLYNDRTFQVRHCQGRFLSFQGSFFEFSQHEYFTGRQPATQPQTWRARLSLLVWAITFDLSGKRDPTNSKPHYYNKVEKTPSVRIECYQVQQ